MAVVELEILEPEHGLTIVGLTPTGFEGRLVSGGSGPLFYKWYSSLHSPPEALHSSNASPSVFSTTLKVGSHVIMFTAKDREGDDLAAIEAVQDAGMTGGTGETDLPPRMVHVFVANLITPPAPPTPMLSKASSTLEVEAPIAWGKEEPLDSGTYIPNLDYHAVNRIRYRWIFAPSGPPAGRASGDLTPSLSDLSFDPTGSVPMVSYQGPLPLPADSLHEGAYTMRLRVEDIQDNSVGDEVSLRVQIVA